MVLALAGPHAVTHIVDKVGTADAMVEVDHASDRLITFDKDHHLHDARALGGGTVVGIHHTQHVDIAMTIQFGIGACIRDPAK